MRVSAFQLVALASLCTPPRASVDFGNAGQREARRPLSRSIARSGRDIAALDRMARKNRRKRR